MEQSITSQIVERLNNRGVRSAYGKPYNYHKVYQALYGRINDENVILCKNEILSGSSPAISQSELSNIIQNFYSICNSSDCKIKPKHHAVFFAILSHGCYSPTIDTMRTMNLLGIVNNKLYRKVFLELEGFGIIKILHEVKYSSITVSLSNNSNEQN